MKIRVFLCFVSLLLLTGCATNFYSLQSDVEIGTQVRDETVAEMRKQGVPINADAARVAQLKEMVRRISSVSDLPTLPYDVVLIQTNIVNAMAAPGGKIMVYEGLWDSQKGLAHDDDEIAAVIAHEIAHVNCRHSTEAMTKVMLANGAALVGVIATSNTKYEKWGQYGATAGLFVYNGIWMTRYSRADENEADSVGLMYMAKAGYDPRAALRIWERAAQKQAGADPASSIFSTHPPDTVRLQNLRAQLPAALAAYEASPYRRTP
jgi:predicted Zn-dependent protease